MRMGRSAPSERRLARDLGGLVEQDKVAVEVLVVGELLDGLLLP